MATYTLHPDKEPWAKLEVLAKYLGVTPKALIDANPTKNRDRDWKPNAEWVVPYKPGEDPDSAMQFVTMTAKETGVPGALSKIALEKWKPLWPTGAPSLPEFTAEGLWCHWVNREFRKWQYDHHYGINTVNYTHSDGTTSPVLKLPYPKPKKTETVDVPPGDRGATHRVRWDRGHYIRQAYERAFGTYDPTEWDPSKGWKANHDRIIKLYEYYAKLYIDNPTIFYWAGLGKMAGSDVVRGVDIMAGKLGESSVTQKMVEIGKAIFYDLAWQHEAYRDSFEDAFRLATERDRESPTPMSSYAKAWSDINSGDATRVFAGNEALLKNEQFVIIQPKYDDILHDPRADLWLSDESFFKKTSNFTLNVHPYHLRFRNGDVLNQQDRWAWITESGGMWEKWKAIPQDERVRLVKLPMDKLVSLAWGNVIDSFVPPGANDDTEE